MAAAEGSAVSTGRTGWLFGGLLAGLGSMLIVLSMAGWWIQDLLRAEAPVLEAAFRIALTLLGIILLVRGSRVVRDAEPSGTIAQPTPAWIEQRQKAAGRQLEEKYRDDTTPLNTFATAIITTSTLRSRVVETISLDTDGQSIRQHVSVEYVRGSDAAIELDLPLIIAPKGDLIDNFSVTDSAGTALTTLSYEEGVELSAQALHILITALYPTLPAPDFSAIELDLLGVIATRGKISRTEVSTIWQEAAQKLRQLRPATTLDPDKLQRLEQYFRTLAVSYPIVTNVAIIAGQERVLIKYERTLIPRELGGRRAKLRGLLGLSSFQIRIPLKLAFSTDSYHLRVEGPGDQYAVGQDVRCGICHRRFQRQWAPGKSQDCKLHTTSDSVHRDYYFRVRERRGQSFVHIYMRGFVKSGFERLELFVKFGERPPGTLGRAVFTALSLVALVAAIGYLSRSLGTGNETSSDVPALLLAFPAVAASYLGLGSSENSLLRTSLAARLSLLISGTLSLLSAVLYLLQNAKIAPRNDAGFIKLFGVQDELWLLLLAAALANFIVVARIFIMRLRYFQQLKAKNLRFAGSPAGQTRPRNGGGGVGIDEDTGTFEQVSVG